MPFKSIKVRGASCTGAGVLLVTTTGPAQGWYWVGENASQVPFLIRHLLAAGIPVEDSLPLTWRDGVRFLEALFDRYGDGAPLHLQSLPERLTLPASAVPVVPRAYEYDEEEVGPDVDFSERVLIPTYRAWKHLRRDARAPWPIHVPPVFMPVDGEDVHQFAARVIDALQRMPGGEDACYAVGGGIEWEAWVDITMSLHGDTGLPAPAKPGKGKAACCMVQGGC